MWFHIYIPNRFLSIPKKKISYSYKDKEEHIDNFKENNGHKIISCILRRVKDERESDKFLPEIPEPFNEFDINISINPNIVDYIKNKIMYELFKRYVS